MNTQDAKERAQDLLRETDNCIRANPVPAVLTALGIGFADGKGESGARGGERLEAERVENACRAGIPWIRDDKRSRAIVERAKCGIFLAACHGL